MKASQLTKENITPEIVDKLLFEGLDYKGETADVIIVLGSRKACDYRVPLAAKLFRKEKPHISYSAEERCKRLHKAKWKSIKPCSYPPKNAAYRPPPYLQKPNPLTQWKIYETQPSLLKSIFQTAKALL